MGRDSNPRYGFPYSSFQDCRLRPLGHPSGFAFTVFRLLNAGAGSDALHLAGVRKRRVWRQRQCARWRRPFETRPGVQVYHCPDRPQTTGWADSALLRDWVFRMGWQFVKILPSDRATLYNRPAELAASPVRTPVSTSNCGASRMSARTRRHQSTRFSFGNRRGGGRGNHVGCGFANRARRGRAACRRDQRDAAHASSDASVSRAARRQPDRDGQPAQVQARRRAGGVRQVRGRRCSRFWKSWARKSCFPARPSSA